MLKNNLRHGEILVEDYSYHDGEQPKFNLSDLVDQLKTDNLYFYWEIVDACRAYQTTSRRSKWLSLVKRPHKQHQQANERITAIIQKLAIDQVYSKTADFVRDFVAASGGQLPAENEHPPLYHLGAQAAFDRYFGKDGSDPNKAKRY